MVKASPWSRTLNGVLDVFHGRLVFSRRVDVLSAAIAAQLPDGARVLDVGSGDGNMGVAVQRLRPDIKLNGIDVFVREKTAYPVAAFDGRHIPYGDNSFDAVMFVDVLHHTEDPTALLMEAARVAPVVVIKDHLREGLLAEETLRAMDWVGNARHGVVLPYNYLNRLQWHAAFARAHLAVDAWNEDVGLYSGPLSLMFDRQLHVVTRLRRTTG